MANTYSQISIHTIFAVKHRENFILNSWRDRLHQYIAGTLQKMGNTPLAVGGWRDHIHAFFGMPVTCCISDLIGAVKANSSKWINKHRFVRGNFEWQSGFAAFSYSRSQRDDVIKYIMRQEEHHRVKTFREEYLEMLNDFSIDYDEKYLFEFYV